MAQLHRRRLRRGRRPRRSPSMGTSTSRPARTRSRVACPGTRARHRRATGTTASPRRRTRPTRRSATSGASAGTSARPSPAGCGSTGPSSTTRSMAQADVRSVMAQAYHHAILPLASRARPAHRDPLGPPGRRAAHRSPAGRPVAARDRRRPADPAHLRRGRRPLDHPRAVAGGRRRRRAACPQRIELGDGLRIVVVFYDAGAVDGGELRPGRHGGRGPLRAPDRAAAPRRRRSAETGMALICTDGELYGHHQPFRDLFLERLLTVGRRTTRRSTR